MISESNLQKKCITYLKSKKIYYINQYGNGRTGKGTPDLVCCINGKFVAFELKVGSNGLQPDQKIRRNQILNSRGRIYTPYTFENFVKIVESEV